MAIAFARFSRWSEALSWVERALQSAADDADRLLRARALGARAQLLDASGELDEALGDVNRAIEIFRELDAEGAGPALRGRWGFADSFIVLAVLLFHHGRAGPNNEIFTELVQEGLEVARRLGDRLAIASALGNLAHHMDPKGDPQRGRQLFDEAVAATRALGSDLMMAGLQQQRAYFEFQSGDVEASRDAWRAAIRHAEHAEQGGMTLLYRAFLAAVEVELGMDAYDEFVANARAVFSDPDVRETAWVSQSLLAFCAGIDASRGDWERVAVAAGAS
ncbi:MAG TPA: tetratricopeptide repeat protein, partial [Thermoanaerobaculia bacterium]|nr:tetratricopeptide repeat protein [Thermoanaerobaculia bacterium]